MMAYLPVVRESVSESNDGEAESKESEEIPEYQQPPRSGPASRRQWKGWRRPMAFVLASLSLVVLIGGGRGTLHGRPSVEVDGMEYLLGPLKGMEEGFTLVAPTFKRPERLSKFLEKYASGDIPSLRRVVILWGDVDTVPPPALIASLPTYAVSVVVELRPHSSLNERFRRSDNMQTECIFALDDDMFFEAADVEMGFQVWKELGRRTRMVGFIPRQVTADQVYQVGGFTSHSMVLTKAAFFHIDWMSAYWSAELESWRFFVDENRNCEDILMSYLVAHHTHNPPIFVDAPFRDDGLGSGISSSPTHLDTRTACVQRFHEAFGQNTLVSTAFKVVRFDGI